jgi:hypothetical protein
MSALMLSERDIWLAARAMIQRYVAESGPTALWRAWNDNVQGHSLDAGHFFRKKPPSKPLKL